MRKREKAIFNVWRCTILHARTIDSIEVISEDPSVNEHVSVCFVTVRSVSLIFQ